MSAAEQPVRFSNGARPPAARRLLHIVVVLPVVTAVLVSQRSSLLSAADRIGGLSPAWLLLALGAETVSFLAAAELQHHLLASTGTRVDRRSLIALSYAGTAISATLPAGPAVSSRYTYRALLRRGTTSGTAAWVLATTAAFSIVALALLGLVGAQLRGLGVLCSAVGGIVGVAVVAGAALALAVISWASRHREHFERRVASMGVKWNALVRTVAQRVGRRVQPVSRERSMAGSFRSEGATCSDEEALGPVRLGVALGLASANWVADVTALAVAFVALGLEVPWQGLLLAYALTQLATSIPLLPGSIGVAEGSMAAALVCAGVHPTAAIAGVLVYRLVSFWLVLPAGWLAWTCLKRGEEREANFWPGPLGPRSQRWDRQPVTPRPI